ncbi:MAG: hypothetical protein IKX54_05475 [Lachnospiraceae bacterium]|nr:hypothetical protein [Lachnospiraceae bacterium]
MLQCIVFADMGFPDEKYFTAKYWLGKLPGPTPFVRMILIAVFIIFLAYVVVGCCRLAMEQSNYATEVRLKNMDRIRNTVGFVFLCAFTFLAGALFGQWFPGVTGLDVHGDPKTVDAVKILGPVLAGVVIAAAVVLRVKGRKKTAFAIPGALCVIFAAVLVCFV